MAELGDDIEYQFYWETNRFFQDEELDSLVFDEKLSGYYDSSSPDGAQSSTASKNNIIVSERNRRKKLNDRLYALRAVVPNISKMDKASIIKDAINYIQELHEQERRMEAEIAELESSSTNKNKILDLDQEDTTPFVSRSKKKKRVERSYDYPIEVIEQRVSSVGDKTVVVSLTFSKRTNAVLKTCQVLESLKLNIITANITALSETLLTTLFIQADEEEKDLLKLKIETAIAALNDPDSPVSGANK